MTKPRSNGASLLHAVWGWNAGLFRGVFLARLGCRRSIALAYGLAAHPEPRFRQSRRLFFLDALYPLFKVGPVLEVALLAFVNDGFGKGRAYALDAIQRGRIGLVDLDVGGERSAHGAYA